MQKTTDLLRKNLHNRLDLVNGNTNIIDPVKMKSEISGKMKALDRVVETAKARIVMECAYRRGGTDTWLNELMDIVKQ